MGDINDKLLYEITNKKLIEIVKDFTKKDFTESKFIFTTERNFELDGRKFKLKLQSTKKMQY